MADVTPQLVPLDRLKPAPWNPRLIRDERFKNLCKSITADPELLLLRPILAQADGTIYAGNMRYRAVEHLKRRETWAVVADVPDTLAKERALKDNQQWGEWQDDQLAEMLYDLKQAGSELDLLGFGQDEIDRLLESVGGGDPLNDDDADLTPPAEPITRPGDLWLMGEHRLLCGDAFIESDHERVLGGQTVDLVLTDPPYGVGIKYGVVDDNHELIKRVITECMPLLVRWPVVLITTGHRWLWEYPTPTWICAWVHPAGMGLGPWGFTCLNPILVYGADPYLKRGMGSRADTLVLAADRAGIDEHPVAKPLDVWEWCMIRGSALDDQLVFDPFAGAGTTIIAAEKLNRRCAAIEIDPAYCDVIVRRWETLTGKKANRA